MPPALHQGAEAQSDTAVFVAEIVDRSCCHVLGLLTTHTRI